MTACPVQIFFVSLLTIFLSTKRLGFAALSTHQHVYITYQTVFSAEVTLHRTPMFNFNKIFKIRNFFSVLQTKKYLAFFAKNCRKTLARFRHKITRKAAFLRIHQIHGHVPILLKKLSIKYNQSSKRFRFFKVADGW